MGLRRSPRALRIALPMLAAALLIAPASASAAAPVACFSQEPSPLYPRQTATFDSRCSTDRDRDIASRAWDLDDDGSFDDGTGVTAKSSWPAPGSHTVRLRVVDRKRSASVIARTVTVRNRGPIASFTFRPADVVVGDTVTLTSASRDSDGAIAAQAWDLDDDGAFTDARGATTTWAPLAAGAHKIALRVTDDRGATATVAHTFVVRERTPGTAPAPLPENAQPLDVPAPGGAAGPLRPLRPFPTVRMRGRTTRRGARLSMLAVRAPHGALAQVRCQGRRCPAKLQSITVRTRSARGAKTVRFKRFERFLPSGVVLQVSVSRPGTVGKFTRIRVRRLARPVRTDRCLVPGSFKPVACRGAR